MKRSRVAIATYVLAFWVLALSLALVLTACGTPLPSPTESPISPPPTPAVEVAEVVPSRTDAGAAAGTTTVYWDDPLVATGFVTVAAGVQSGGPGGYVVRYVCQGPDEACAAYPVTRTVEAGAPEDACAVELALVIDLEARRDGRVLAATTLRTPLVGAREPGTGQYDGDIPWAWEVPVEGTAELWQRLRWTDYGGTVLPDVVVPYHVVGGALRETDERGFSLVKVVEGEYRYYFPVVGGAR